MELREIAAEEFCHCPVSVFGRKKLLLTAEGADGRANVMTVGWGGIGYFWGVPVVFYGIRPERYTFPFAEEGSNVSLCAFSEEYAGALAYCGTHSGKEGDKWSGAGLTRIRTPDGITAVAEAQLIITATKSYAMRLSEDGFFNKDHLTWYREGGYHTVYFSRIRHIYLKE